MRGLVFVLGVFFIIRTFWFGGMPVTLPHEPVYYFETPLAANK